MNNLNYSDNLMSRRWRKRYEEQPEHVKRRLDALDEIDVKEYQLKVIKRTRKYPNKGDVFLVEPQEGIYFYGLVINNHVNNIQGDDLLVIMIFRNRANGLTNKSFELDYNNLLIEPCMVGKEYWTRGYFYTIDNIEYEKSDYGFYSISKNKFFNEYEEELYKEPKLLGVWGVSTIFGIAIKIQEELIIDKSLLLQCSQSVCQIEKTEM